MAWGYLLLIAAGLSMIVTGFYGAFVYKGKKVVIAVLSALMPLGLIVTLLGILLTVLPDFFRETRW